MRRGIAARLDWPGRRPTPAIAPTSVQLAHARRQPPGPLKSQQLPQLLARNETAIEDGGS
jgi:hypothetical protein